MFKILKFDFSYLAWVRIQFNFSKIRHISSRCGAALSIIAKDEVKLRSLVVGTHTNNAFGQVVVLSKRGNKILFFLLQRQVVLRES